MLQKLVVLVEEPSMEAALELLLPQLLGGVDFDIHPFQGKHNLLQKLPERLKGYASWLPDNWWILVLVDRDDDNCVALKNKLEGMAARAGLLTKTASRKGQAFQVINRIAIEELEAWFFGDWTAVQTAYPRVGATVPKQAAYRNPDAIAGGTWEALERVLQKAGYFSTGISKIALARAVAAHMQPQRNLSRSFQAFASALASAAV